MKDEIKEILDRLDYNEWEVALYKVPITWCELYDIRDYITNLQQENERLKEYIRIANVSEWFKGNDSLEKLLRNDRKDDKKTISKADFNKVWSESTTEDILNQFYYEHNDLREMLKENGNKEEVTIVEKIQ